MCLKKNQDGEATGWTPLGFLNKTYENTLGGLMAKKGFNDLDPEQKKKICNGAGPGGSGLWNRFLTWLIPDEFYGLDLTPVFDIHDHCYHVGGKTWWRKAADDLVMLVNAVIMIWQAGKKKRWRRIRRAAVYWVGVSIGGKKSFKYTGE